MITKTIYAAKPFKSGYKITRYKYDGDLRHYTDINVLVLLADKEQAQTYIDGVKTCAEYDGFKTEIETTKKWIFLTIDGDYEINGK